MLIASIIGTLTGGLTSILPGVLSYLQRRDELKYELQLLQLKSKLSEQNAQQELDLINARADIDEGKSIRSHDASLDGGRFINALRASVRPVITYIFFFLFVFVKVMAVLAGVQSAGSEDWLGNALAWNNLMPIIWDDQTAAIFGAIIGFWFGGRAIDKLMRR